MTILLRIIGLSLFVLVFLSETVQSVEPSRDEKTEDWMWSLSDKTAVDRYFVFEFQPQFKQEQCIVKFVYVFHKSGEDWPESSLYELFKSYLWKHEPAAGLFNMETNTVGSQLLAYVMFPENCDRRFEIADSMARFAMKADSRYEVKATRELVIPGRETITGSRFWIDDPNYNSEDWKTFQKAMQGDGESIFHMAEKIDRETAAIGSYIKTMRAYVTYMWAVDCLPPGSLRAEAKKRSSARWSNMPADYRDKAREALSFNRNDADRLGVVCGQ